MFLKEHSEVIKNDINVEFPFAQASEVYKAITEYKQSLPGLKSLID